MEKFEKGVAIKWGLGYINFKNFNDINITSYTNIFKAVPENAVLCINEKLKVDKILAQFIPKKCYVVM